MSHTTLCKHCGKKFTTKHKSALYCGGTCRVRAFRAGRQTCWYCGDPANSRDHVIPHKLTGNIVRKWTGVDIVECCADCNSSLGDKLFDRMSERVAWLAKRFCTRHGLDKPHATWDEDGLAELEGNLLQHVKAKQVAWQMKQTRYLYMLLRVAQLEDVEQQPE